jgi:hypothetical protein
MKLIGTTGTLIDWNLVITQCESTVGNNILYTAESFPKSKHFDEMDIVWKAAGYQYGDPTIEWTNFFPEANFNKTIVDTFESIVNATPWMVWISRIRPGKMAPWHFDAHSNIDELLTLGNPVRYTCYIQAPHDGHVSVVGDTAVYKPECGSIYEWPNYDAWHCGMNGGLVNKYMFNFWGFQ